MTVITTAKITLALVGIGFILIAARTGQAWFQWLAFGLIAAAWGLRFIERGQRRGTPYPHADDAGDDAADPEGEEPADGAAEPAATRRRDGS